MPAQSDDDFPLGLWRHNAPSAPAPGRAPVPHPRHAEAWQGSRARLPISRIDPDPRNPRAPTDAEVEALADSIQSSGLLQPIVVRATGQRYTIVAGHRRFAAWCHCASAAPSDPRWRTIDVLVRALGAEEALTLMLVENLHRKALSPLQEAVTLQRLRLGRGWTNRQVADAVHKSEMYVSRRLRVLEDELLRDAVLGGQLAVTTAEELLTADDRASLVERAIAEDWSPADARRAVQAARARRRARSVSDERWRAHLAALEHLLDAPAALPTSARDEIADAARRLLARCLA